MIKLTAKGDFSKANTYLEKLGNTFKTGKLDIYGQRGVEALRAATPKKTGVTANSWRYDVRRDSNSISIEWSNTNNVRGVNIAVILQYGHGTGWGGYVKGIDYVNPALEPLFNEIVEEMCREVTSL